MDPRDASVYTDNWSPITWVLIISVVIVFMLTLMVGFIAAVHHTIERSADTPRVPASEDFVPVPSARVAVGHAGSAEAGSPHAA